MKSLLSLLCLLLAITGARAESIVVASTTSVENSGLLAHILPGFTAKTGIEVRVVAQGGDGGNHNGTGGSSKPNLKQEFNKEPHVRGVCSMARTMDPNSANSQFFICFDDARFLDGQYTVLGEVTEGM